MVLWCTLLLFKIISNQNAIGLILLFSYFGIHVPQNYFFYTIYIERCPSSFFKRSNFSQPGTYYFTLLSRLSPWHHNTDGLMHLYLLINRYFEIHIKKELTSPNAARFDKKMESSPPSQGLWKDVAWAAASNSDGLFGYPCHEKFLHMVVVAKALCLLLPCAW